MSEGQPITVTPSDIEGANKPDITITREEVGQEPDIKVTPEDIEEANKPDITITPEEVA